MANVRVLGILFPIQRGSRGYFTQGTTIMEQARSNLINLIMTRKGERIMQPTFGCDVYKVIFEPMTDNNIANVRGTIESAVKTWLPYLKIVTVVIDAQPDYNTIYASLTFSLTVTPTITDTITLKF